MGSWSMDGADRALGILFRDNPVPMWVSDRATFRFLEVNRAAIERYGYSREEFLAMTALDIRPPEDADLFLRFVRHDAPAPLHQGVWRHRTKSGELMDVEILVRDVQFADRLCRLVVAVDATERREIRRLLTDASSEAIWEWDLTTEALWWSRGVERFGYRPEELEAGTKSWTSRILPAELERVSAGLQEVVAAGTTWHDEYHFRRKDGTYAPVADRGTVVRDAKGRAVRMVGAMTDLSRERRDERRIREQAERLGVVEDEQRALQARFLRAQRMESIGALAGGMAHDLNNMLAPILMAGSVLQGKVQDAEARALLDTVEASARRAAELVTQVLALGRDLEGVRAALDPGVLVREIARVARETLPRSIEVRIAVESDGWAVRAVPSEIHQILLNLVVNARDAMPEGGTLKLGSGWRLFDAESQALMSGAVPGPYVVFTVEDSGDGIDPSVRARLFEPLFTTKSAAHGTGLGLSTALAIAKSHGGFIEVESELGRGSAFRVFLPAEPVSVDDRDLADPPRGDGERILVVNDEAAVRAMTRTVLETYGYRVLTATDGAEALALIDRLHPELDVVITDLLMPTMDGAVLTGELRRRGLDLPIIVATGAPSDPLAETARTAGATVVLTAPYSAESLLLTIAEVLRLGH